MQQEKALANKKHLLTQIKWAHGSVFKNDFKKSMRVIVTSEAEISEPRKKGGKGRIFKGRKKSRQSFQRGRFQKRYRAAEGKASRGKAEIAEAQVNVEECKLTTEDTASFNAQIKGPNGQF